MAEEAKEILANVILLPPSKVTESLKNKRLAAKLVQVAQRAQQNPDFTPNADSGKLLYQIASTVPNSLEQFEGFFIDAVASGKITLSQQIIEGIEYFKQNMSYDEDSFNQSCGIGVVVTETDVLQALESIISQNQEKIVKEGWDNRGLQGQLMGKVKSMLKWADSNMVRNLVDQKLLELLGPKPAVQAPKKKNKGKKQSPVQDESALKKDKLSTCIGRDLHSSVNSKELMEKHLAVTGGKIFTRFPPEPNGYLHIGHAKAIRFNFQMAIEHEGECYLRFDDTNPEKETEEYINNIIENVNWMGYTPWKITHASDYFPEMYDLAVKLIKDGNAYVDKQPGPLIKQQRKEMVDSPYRDAPVEKNLHRFEKMRKGLFEEGGAVLRMKIDMKHNNPCMRDPVAYRIKYVPHPHVGDRWCVYPTYDMEHCIVDSLENITHSLCTLEFEVRRDSYYWLVEALGMFKSAVWEYSRLNLTYTVLSKRKLQRLVQEGFVWGWDDPRMPTINGLRRRGYTPQSICNFVDQVGVARRGNDSIISIQLLEHFIRKDLDENAPRTMAVIDPLEVQIVGVEARTFSAPYFPKDQSKGSYQLSFTPDIFIERADFNEEYSAKFFGVSPNRVVGLKYLPFRIQLSEVIRDEQGKAVKLICNSVESSDKVQGVLHWISKEDAVEAEVRLLNNLFKSEDPNKFEDFTTDLNPESLVVMKNSLIQRQVFENCKEQDKFQFERVGFFTVDKDSNETKKVFNRVVTLQESKKKGNQIVID